MAVSDVQRATLELVLEAGESYGAIAETVGLEAAEVRATAHEAVAGMSPRVGADEEWTDLLLGQLRSAEAQEEALTRLAGDGEALAEARRVTALLKLIAPAAQIPNLPRPGAAGPAAPAPAPKAEPAAPEPEPEPKPVEPTAEVAPPAPTPNPEPEAPETPPRAPRDSADEPPTERGVSLAAPEATPTDDSPAGRDAPAGDGDAPAGPVGLDRGQKKLLAGLLGAGFVVIAIVLGVSGVLGGSDDGDDGAVTAAGETTEAVDGEASPEDVIRAVLRSPGDGEAAGEAVFGSVDDAPALQVVARGLAPTGQGDEYNIWLYQTDEFLLRLDGQQVDENGVLISQIELPIELLNMIMEGQFNQVDVSRASVQDYRREFNRATNQGGVPRHVGRTVLRGPITGPGLTGAATE